MHNYTVCTLRIPLIIASLDHENILWAFICMHIKGTRNVEEKASFEKSGRICTTSMHVSYTHKHTHIHTKTNTHIHTYMLVQWAGGGTGP